VRCQPQQPAEFEIALRMSLSLKTKQKHFGLQHHFTGGLCSNANHVHRGAYSKKKQAEVA